MELLKKIGFAAALCVLMTYSLNGSADEMQDASRLFKQGQLDQALVKVDGILATKPKDAQARFLKGLILTEQGNTTEAIKTFSALTEDYPELPEPYNNLAVLYAGQGQYEKARVALEMAIRTHPSYATAHENLGDIYAKMASQAYDRALQLDKSNTDAQIKLALIRDLLDKGGRTAETPTAVLAKAAPASKPTEVAVVPVAPFVVQRNAEPAAPVPAPEKAPSAPDVRVEIEQATRDWARAWSRKDVPQYLSFYAQDFKTPGGQSRSAWEALRKERLTKPKSIQVGVSNLKVTLIDAQQARATFTQNYRASHFKSINRKTLVWTKLDGRWQIIEEKAGE